MTTERYYIERKRPAFIIILLLLTLFQVSGQAGYDMTTRISQRFQSYCRSIPWEEIYIHTDRDEYIAGEDIWFSAYLFDRQSFKLSLHSKIIYLELLNPLNNPLIQQKILLQDGPGQGHFRLADSLTSGTYTIRAYTKWMQNFSPGNCFMKDINIYSSQPSKKFYKKVVIEEVQSGTDYRFWNGLMMKAGSKENGDVDISVEAPNDTLDARNDKFYIFILSHGNIVHSSADKLTGGHARITVPGKTFLPGISQITLFDSLGRPLSDRFIYIRPQEIPQPVALAEKDSIKTREKISLEFLFHESLSDLHHPGLSVSVTPKTNNTGSPDLNEYLVFGTEFG
ncbi:MAG: hypothetical protein NT092_05350 [Bacteroidia bacterium]|nr:hypothetical protein [Bacteroidia bacterium]